MTKCRSWLFYGKRCRWLASLSLSKTLKDFERLLKTFEDFWRLLKTFRLLKTVEGSLRPLKTFRIFNFETLRLLKTFKDCLRIHGNPVKRLLYKRTLHALVAMKGLGAGVLTVTPDAVVGEGITLDAATPVAANGVDTQLRALAGGGRGRGAVTLIHVCTRTHRLNATATHRVRTPLRSHNSTLFKEEFNAILVIKNTKISARRLSLVDSQEACTTHDGE